MIRDHIGIDDTYLKFLLRHGHDGVGSYFRAGSCGGWDHNDGNAFFRPSRIVQKLLYAVFIGHKNTCQLGGIHHASASAGYDHIRSAFLKSIYQFLDSHITWLCRQIIQHIVIGSRRLYRLFRQSKQAGGFNSLIGKHGYFLRSLSL